MDLISVIKEDIKRTKADVISLSTETRGRSMLRPYGIFRPELEIRNPKLETGCRYRAFFTALAKISSTLTRAWFLSTASTRVHGAWGVEVRSTSSPTAAS